MKGTNFKQWDPWNQGFPAPVRVTCTEWTTGTECSPHYTDYADFKPVEYTSRGLLRDTLGAIIPFAR